MDTARLDWNPEEVGMRLVAEMDWAGAWEFDKVCVWEELSTHKLWAAHDSGCSCPIPFEGHTFPTDFTEVRSVDDTADLVLANVSQYRCPSMTQLRDFKTKVEEALMSPGLNPTRIRRNAVLGKGATDEQKERLHELAPNAAVEIKHHRQSEVARGRHMGEPTFFDHKLPTGGYTVVRIYPTGDRTSSLWVEGQAICHERDNYQKRLGVHIALARALEKLPGVLGADYP